MSEKSKLSSFVSTAESLTGHPVVFAGNETLHDYASMNPEAAKIMGWPDKTDAIIIDKNQTVEEQIHDVIHETVEESEIRQGLSYHDAHVIALKAEETIKTPEQLVERVERIAGHKVKYSVTAHKGNRKIHRTKSKSDTGLGSVR